MHVHVCARAQVVQPCDPRIHFALVCGAKSCPPIKVYTPDNLEEGLQVRAPPARRASNVDATGRVQAALQPGGPSLVAVPAPCPQGAALQRPFVVRSPFPMQASPS